MSNHQYGTRQSGRLKGNNGLLEQDLEQARTTPMDVDANNNELFIGDDRGSKNDIRIADEHSEGELSDDGNDAFQLESVGNKQKQVLAEETNNFENGMFELEQMIDRNNSIINGIGYGFDENDENYIPTEGTTNETKQLFAILKQLMMGIKANKMEILQVRKETKEANNNVLVAIRTIGDAIRPVLTTIPPIVEKVEKKERIKERKAMAKETKWWTPNLVIEVDGNERLLGEFTRQEIGQMILERQKQWHCPKILEADLRTEVVSTLCPVYELIDQPRKFGWAIAQFLRGGHYFSGCFIPMFKAKDDLTKSRDATGTNRPNINPYDSRLLLDLFLFCGGNLVVSFPKMAQGRDNRRLEFLNYCRDGINSNGNDIIKKNTIQNYMVPEFVSILNRLLFKENYEEALRRIAQEKQMKSQQRKEQKKDEVQSNGTGKAGHRKPPEVKYRRILANSTYANTMMTPNGRPGAMGLNPALSVAKVIGMGYGSIGSPSNSAPSPTLPNDGIGTSSSAMVEKSPEQRSNSANDDE